MKKEHIVTILEYLFVFIIVYTFNCFFYNNGDHIVDFTHCYSIANNLRIYRDFNIVVGPVYPVLISIFLRIFGKNFIVFHLVNSSFIVGIYALIKKHNKKTLAILVIACSQFALPAKYNLFTLLLFYIIYYTEIGNSKYKDYIIGFFLSILVFTKINIGSFLIIPTFILYFKKPKIILKRFISFIIPSILIILIMLLYGVLPGFINYTLLGLISFSKHKMIDVYVVFLILAVIYLLKNIRKDKYLIYMFCYLIMCYPLFESGHIIIGVFPTFVYAIDKLKQDKEETIKKVAVLLSGIIYIMYATVNFYEIDKKYTPTKDHSIDCKNSFCAQDYLVKGSFKYAKRINQYLEKRSKGYKTFYFTYNAYYFRLNANQNINKYDFIWDGNMGYKGEDTYIKEIKNYCKNHKCMFLIDKSDIYKRTKKDLINYKILKFVETNYKEVSEDEFLNKTVYTLYVND